jgi:LmbE family N-acetylglucosaminyl deacetylase
MVDGQYGTPLDVNVLSAQLLGALVKIQPRVIVVPLGLVHPDHATVADACRYFIGAGCFPSAEWWIYEDQPSRVIYPESVPGALEVWREFLSEDLGVMSLDFLGTAPLNQKEEAVRCYASQLWALDLHCVLTPERLWRLSR